MSCDRLLFRTLVTDEADNKSVDTKYSRLSNGFNFDYAYLSIEVASRPRCVQAVHIYVVVLAMLEYLSVEVASHPHPCCFPRCSAFLRHSPCMEFAFYDLPSIHMTLVHTMGTTYFVVYHPYSQHSYIPCAPYFVIYHTIAYHQCGAHLGSHQSLSYRGLSYIISVNQQWKKPVPSILSTLRV